MSRHARGLTLIELLVTITIVGIVMTGVVGALASHSVQGANRMIRQQATAIASAYLEEIMQRPFSGTPGVKPRALYDNVNDYLALPDAVVRDQQGLAIPNLGQYSVIVQVMGGTMPVVPAVDTRLITVTVTHSTGLTVRLSGYKTNHPPL